jgi:hypothetical protein
MAAVATRAPAPRAAVFAVEAPTTARRAPWMPAAAALLVVIAITGVVAGIIPPRDQEVAAVTDAPTDPNAAPTGFVVAPVESDGTTVEPTGTEAVVTPGQETKDPVVGPGPDDPTQLPPPPEPDRTPKPPKPTPTPDPATPTPAPPTPAPTPVPPTPTPVPPTPTPVPMCTVPDLIGLRVSPAKTEWANAGFTTELVLGSSIPNGHEIVSQSIEPGTDEPCDSVMTVDD